MIRLLREILPRLRFLLAPRPQPELDDELSFHIAQSTDRNLAVGMSPAEAHRQALIELGGIQRTREQCHQQRPGWWLATVAQDIRYALRGFRRNPVFTLAVIATLCVGIGATTAVFSVVDRILFRPLPYAHPDRLVSFGLSQPLQRQEFTLGGFFYEWRDNQQPFESVTFEQGTNECNLTEANPAHLQCARIAQNFLPTLGIPPQLGRNFTPEEDEANGPKVALISDGLWLSRYNRDPRILNQFIPIDDHPVRIVGVLPASFEMPRLQPADIVRPAQVDVAAQHNANAGIGVPMWAFARLKPGVSVAQAHAEMQPLFLHTQQWIPAQFRQEFHFQVRSIRDRQMQEAYTAAWVLLGAVFVVLLIACANVASLFSARGASRQRELAVRSALGASRLRLIRQTLTEVALLAVAGAVLGCVLAQILLRVFIAIAPTGVPFLADAKLDFRIVLFTVALTVICAALVGMFPALEKPRSSALAARQTRSSTHARLRRVLVAVQIGLSVVLLSGAALLLKSFLGLENQRLGMQTAEVITVHIPVTDERYPTGTAYLDFYQHAEAALRRLPGVTAVGMSDSLPPDGNAWHHAMRYADFFVDGKPAASPTTGGSVVWRLATPDYFRALQIPILQGRGFTEQDRSTGGDLIVLSKLLADRLFPNENAIGQHIQFGNYNPYFVLDGPVFTVVGVAGNVRNQGLADQVNPEFYELWSNHHPESWNSRCTFLLQTSLGPSVIAPWVRSQIAQLDPTAPVEINTMAQTVTRLADRPRFETALLAFFALCGLLMAVIGLYGVISFVATQRTQEIGIRMALGATRLNILRLIAAEGVRLILLGGVLGLAAALASAQLLKSLLFNVAPHDPLTYAAVTLLLAMVALAATLIPARAAMKVEPVVALRYE